MAFREFIQFLGYEKDAGENEEQDQGPNEDDT